jgi:TonB family protein
MRARAGLALAAAAALLAGASLVPGLDAGEARADAGSFWQRLWPTPQSQYKRASELDARPAALGEIQPVPPPGSEAKGGRVVARILINESGEADRVLVEASEPPGLFDASVVTAFGAARYRPGVKAGVPVKSQMRVEVRFEPQPKSGQRPLRP